MDNTRLVTELCAIIDRMNVILQAQAMELAQLHALRHEEEIAAVRRDYARAIGGGGPMTAAEVLTGGGIILVAMTLIQIAPIKLDPWSAVARAIGRAINKDVIEKLDETREILDAHIKMDGARTADAHRARILQFNNELLRDIPHTQEEFVEILAEIDQYEKYCKENPDYQNNRTTHAVANISRVYDDRLIKHDFLREDEP